MSYGALTWVYLTPPILFENRALKQFYQDDSEALSVVECDTLECFMVPFFSSLLALLCLCVSMYVCVW